MDIYKLIEDLKSEDVSTRRTAAKDLAVADERAVYSLLSAMRDPNPGVQDAAMNSLISIGGEMVAYMVLPLLREDSFLRNTAMLILKDIGEPSVKLLYPLLTDKDDDVRKFALDLLGDIKEGVDPAMVLPLLKDPNANARASAVRAIGILMGEEAFDSLIETLDDEEWVSFAAIETLASLKDDRAVGPITAMLEGDSLTLRMAAVETLGAIGSGKASEALFEHVRRTEGMEQSEAIKSLVQTGVTPSMSAVYDLLLDLVQNGEWEEQAISIKGLVDLKDENAIPIILDVAGRLDESVPGEDERLIFIMDTLKGFGPSDIYGRVITDPETRFRARELAAEVAGETRSERAVPVLIDYLKKDLRDVKRACALALGKIGTPDAVKALLEAVDDHEGHVRKTAIMGLGQSGDVSAFQRLYDQLDIEEYDDIVEDIVKALIAIDAPGFFSGIDKLPSKVRVAAARASTDLDVLLRLSLDEDLSVSLAAIAGLSGMEDGRAVDRVLEAVGSFDPEVRRTAAMSLSGMDAGLEVVLPLLDDKDMWVRLHAVRMLGKIGGEQALPGLSRMLEDRDTPVVLAAVESLAVIGGRDAYEVLAGKEEHPDERVREAVSKAIEGM